MHACLRADRAAFVRALEGLVRVAAALSATIAWPALDCAMPWVGGWVRSGVEGRCKQQRLGGRGCAIAAATANDLKRTAPCSARPPYAPAIITTAPDATYMLAKSHHLNNKKQTHVWCCGMACLACGCSCTTRPATTYPPTSCHSRASRCDCRGAHSCCAVARTPCPSAPRWIR